MLVLSRAAEILPSPHFQRQQEKDFWTNPLCEGREDPLVLLILEYKQMSTGESLKKSKGSLTVAFTTQ